MKTNPKVECLVDNHHGIYVPQTFARQYQSQTDGVSNEDWQSLLAGPENNSYLWSWDNALNNAILTSETGDKYRIAIGEQGDVFCVPIDWEWSDWEQTWVCPESETLKRFVLPSLWEDDGWLANDLPNSEMSQIESFLTANEMQKGHWVLASVSPSNVTRWNDARTGLIQDCAQFTFIKR